jgi:hypothetical protein
MRAGGGDAFAELPHELRIHLAKGPREHHGVDLHHRIGAVLNFTVQQVEQLKAVPATQADARRGHGPLGHPPLVEPVVVLVHFTAQIRRLLADDIPFMQRPFDAVVEPPHTGGQTTPHMPHMPQS